MPSNIETEWPNENELFKIGLLACSLGSLSSLPCLPILSDRILWYASHCALIGGTNGGFNSDSLNPIRINYYNCCINTQKLPCTVNIMFPRYLDNFT